MKSLHVVNKKENPNKGIWKSFFNLCLKSNLPIIGIIVYCAISMYSSKLYLLIPSKTGELFAGNVSVQIVTVIIVSQILNSTLGQISTFVNKVVGAKIDRNFRNVLWKKTLQLPMNFFDKVPANNIISRVTSDTEKLRVFIIDVVVGEFLGLYVMYITLRQISEYDNSLVYILAGLIPVVIILSIILGQISLNIQIRYRDEVANLTQFLSELVMSIPMIKAFNKENYESQRGNDAIDRLYGVGKLQLYFGLAKNPINTLIGLGKNLALIFIGIRFLNNGTLDAATWYAFYLFATNLLNMVSSKELVWEKIKATQGSLYRVSQILEEPEEGFQPYKLEVVETGDLTFDNITFSYDDNPLIESVSFTIPENKTTAIVGPSGIGKTTVIKLIERFYQPCKGKIIRGDVDIQDFNINEWRSQITYISQNIAMMSGTIKENIVYGVKREVTEDELIEAAKVANAHDFIMMQPDGYDTQVGQFGSKLSGGQRQRIAIARALLSKTSILILDEPTSNLDPVASVEVMKGLNNLKMGRTTIVTSHDEKAIRNSDYIIVFNPDGTVERGTHMELLATNNFYRYMMGGEISA